MTRRVSRRQFLAYTAATGGVLTLFGCRPGSSGGASDDDAGGSSGLPDIEGGELISDPSQFPSRFGERPEFAEMVAAGTLPPVAERIGQDPLVIRPLDGVGSYGGTIRRAYLDHADVQIAARFCAGPDSLLYWDMNRETVIPNVAREFELSDDFTELIVHLRRGMRWSDGAPFTADDVVFWRNDMSLNGALPAAPSLIVEGQEVAVERIDDFTVRYRSPAPHPLLPALLASGHATDVGGQSIGGDRGEGGFAPMHYLSQFHPAYTSEAEANRLAADAGFNGWVQYFTNRSSWNLNPELPTLTPWILTRPANDPPWELFANPYSVWVDTDGNQLPYIGEITMDLVQDVNVLVLRASAGEMDFLDRSLGVAQLPTLLENQQRGDYTIHQTPSERIDFGIRINLAYDADPVIGELLRTVEFRRALSLGIDRDQVNEAFFLGTGTPSATMAADASPYFPGAEWRTKWATHDPDQANELLDDIGLTDTDGDGFRLRPDGTGRLRLDYQVGAQASAPAIGEMIRGQWVDIGVDLNVQELAGNLLVERIEANEIVLSGLADMGTDDPFLAPAGFVLAGPGTGTSIIGVPYLRWFETNGREGVEPPESLRQLVDATELYRHGLQAPDEERFEIGKELYQLHADQVWSIGIVGFGLGGRHAMYLANNRLRNVPARVLNTTYQRSPTNALPMTFYYE